MTVALFKFNMQFSLKAFIFCLNCKNTNVGFFPNSKIGVF